MTQTTLGRPSIALRTLILGGILLFLLGLLVGRTSQPGRYSRAIIVPTTSSAKDSRVSDELRLRNRSDVDAARKHLIKQVFGADLLPAAIPRATREDPPAGAKSMVRLESGGHVLEPVHWNGKVAIYHAGHYQSALGDGLKVVRAMLGSGFRVIALDMPPTPHERFSSHRRPLEAFLLPVVSAINYATADGAADVVMMGLSGGGWTTVLAAAMDERISTSIPVAGSWPFYLRKESDNPNTIGDYEQQLPGLDVGYLDLYLMASIDQRQQIQIFNSHDPCCFAGLGSETYREEIADLSGDLGGTFTSIIVLNNAHSISDQLLPLFFPATGKGSFLPGDREQ